MGKSCVSVQRAGYFRSGLRMLHAAAALVAVSGATRAATFYVAPNGNDSTGAGTLASPYATIQKGIAIAGPSDSVVVEPGTYVGVGNRDLSFAGKNIAVRAEYGPDQTVIDCQGLGRGFLFNSAESPNALLEGFTIRNGKSPTEAPTGISRGGGIACIGASPTLSRCNLVGCQAVGADGGPGGDGCGGGLYLLNSAASVTRCRFEGGRAQGGADLLGSIPTALGGAGRGGGVYAENGSPNFSDCDIRDNTALGGDADSALATATTSGDGQGGGACFKGGSPNIARCVIENNVAQIGQRYWGISVADGTARGPGVMLDDAAADLDDCRIIGNQEAAGGSLGFGGGVCHGGAPGASTLRRCLLSGNYGSFGGGLTSESGQISAVDTVFYFNTGINGGGVDIEGGAMDALGCSFFANLGYISDTSAATTSIAGQLMVRNTLMAENSGGSVSGNVGSNGHNLVDDLTLAPAGPGDLLGVNARAMAAANFGGIAETIRLAEGSPAIDAGDNSGVSATDQRGAPRIYDGDGDTTATVDIGAFEFGGQPAALPATPTPYPAAPEPVNLIYVAPSGSDTGGNGTMGSPYQTIQKGIDMAVSRSNTVVALNGVYRGTGNRNITFRGKAITVRSLNGSSAATIDCQGAARAFLFDSGEGQASVLRGFRIINGRAPLYASYYPGGAVFCDGASPTIQDCRFESNQAIGLSGGFGAAAYGGAICLLNSSPKVSNCEFVGNLAQGGHADFAVADGHARGGAVAAIASDLSIQGCLFSGNQAQGGSNSDTFTYASGGAAGGGGVYSEGGGTLAIEACEFVGNQCEGGSSVAGGGNSSGSAAAAWVPFTMRNCWVHANVSLGPLLPSFGAVAAFGSSFALIEGCAIEGNVGNIAVHGGGVFADCPTTVRNCTISSNQAGFGAGVSFDQPGVADSLTIVENAASVLGNGGGVACEFGAAAILNCVISANTPDGVAEPGGMARSAGYNLVQTGSSSIFATPTDLNGANPLLGIYGNYGGPTYTYALLAGSPAIDSGNTVDFPSADQRGKARPADGDGDLVARADRGAYEHVPPPNSASGWELYR